MAEEVEKESREEGAEGEESGKASSSQKIMCFVSKQMVPLNETVEIEYAPRKKVRVLPKYIKYEEASAEA